MHKSRYWWLVVCLLTMVDLYFFQSVQLVTANSSGLTQGIIYSFYCIVSAGSFIVLFLLPKLHFEKEAKLGKAKIFALIAGLFIGKIVGSIVFLIDDLRRLTIWIFSQPAESVTRSFTLSMIGLSAGTGLFLALIYGFTNKYRYRIKRVKLHYPNLPASFKGTKAVHISDIHSGSFTNKDAVIKGVEMIMKEKPDLILFTGDLVNNVAGEMKDYMDVFDKLKAPLGVYSTLGNHDYGDYVHWNSTEEKAKNLEQLMKVHADLGWRLLMNEHVVLEKDEERIAIIGIENWSAKARFPSYGDLRKAYYGAEDYPFKILMSHDPSHWKAEVLESYSDIDLTLAGHTHGMQFGFEIPWLKWSPVRHVYKEWAGLYESEDQKLYINRGFGFVGYPGRVGILPEITVLEFSH